MEGSFHGGILHGEREFFMKGTPDFPALFKNDQKLNTKNKLFQLKVRSNIKT
jgi:hypothetical protein